MSAPRLSSCYSLSEARAASVRLMPSSFYWVAFFYSGLSALRSPSTTRSTLPIAVRWIAQASVSTFGSVTRFTISQRARYSLRTSNPLCLMTAASICISAMLSACRALIRSMSSVVFMRQQCAAKSALSTSI